jgi:hypothetical protein
MKKSVARGLREENANEAAFIQSNTQVVSRSTVHGHITKDQFARALHYLERKYAILNVADALGSFVERSKHYHNIIAWAFNIQCEEIYGTLLNFKLDTSVSLYSIQVVEYPNSFDIYIVISHALADATSIVDLHNDLILFCDADSIVKCNRVAKMMVPEN